MFTIHIQKRQTYKAILNKLYYSKQCEVTSLELREGTSKLFYVFMRYEGDKLALGVCRKLQFE